MQVNNKKAGNFRNCAVCGQFFTYIPVYHSCDQLCTACEREDEEFYKQFCGYEFVRQPKQ